MKSTDHVSAFKIGTNTEARDLVEAVIALFASIACEEGWQPNGELDAYRDRSTYFALADTRGQVIGGLQLIAPGLDGTLSCVKVWPELTETIVQNQKTIAHISILAISREWRGKYRENGVSSFWRLTAAMWNHCVRKGITEIWLESTPKTYRAYCKLGWPLEVRGELRSHWGEACFPCSLSVRQVAGAIAERAVRSRTYRHILSDMVEDKITNEIADHGTLS